MRIRRVHAFCSAVVVLVLLYFILTLRYKQSFSEVDHKSHPPEYENAFQNEAT